MVYGRASPIWDAILNRRVSNDSVSLTEILRLIPTFCIHIPSGWTEKIVWRALDVLNGLCELRLFGSGDLVELD